MITQKFQILVIQGCALCIALGASLLTHQGLIALDKIGLVADISTSEQVAKYQNGDGINCDWIAVIDAMPATAPMCFTSTVFTIDGSPPDRLTVKMQTNRELLDLVTPVGGDVSCQELSLMPSIANGVQGLFNGEAKTVRWVCPVIPQSRQV